jgi:putative tryptophan/tyrosine transport system substrate-binding protein
VRRREFITLLSGAAAWPLAASAQQPTMPVIGFLGAESPQLWAHRMPPFHQGLAQAGFVEGRNVAIEYRWAHGHNDRLRALAADLIDRPVSVIAVPTSTPATLVLKAATKTIPVVFNVGGDPVAAGLVASLNRPGGNLTGVATLGLEIAPKRIELLHELLPNLAAVAVLLNPTSPALADAQVNAAETAAAKLNLKVHLLRASTEGELDQAFDEARQLQAATAVSADSFFLSRAKELATLAARHAVPTIYTLRDYPTVGGLISYGSNLAEGDRTVGLYTGRILKGEKPADLPVQLATKIELVINMKAAKALGLDIPPSLLARADEVIE